MFKKFKALFGAQDMTVGSPLKCLLMFSVPLLIGNFAQLLYSTVDSIVVGKYVGDIALSAIGVTSPLQALFLVLFMAIGSDVMVMVSQYFGAKEYENLEKSIGNAITLIAIASVILTVGGLLLTDWMLTAIETPPETYEMARTYLVVCFFGMAGNGFYNIMSGVLRGMGESVFPLIVLLFTTVLNIVLDLWFVAGLNMGIAGAAWATIIGQTLSAIVCLAKVLMIKDIIKIKPRHLILKKDIVMNICRLGIPNGIAQAVMFLSTIIIQRLINSMGYIVTAAITAVLRVDSFAVIPSQTFNMSVSTFTGQNIGAGKMDRVKQGFKTCMILGLIVTTVMVILMLVFGKWMIGLFTETQELIDLGYKFIITMLPAYFLMTVGQSLGGVVRGAGDSMGPMWISLITNTIIRIPAAYLIAHLTVSELYPQGDPRSTFIALSIAMGCNLIASLVYYFKGPWKNKAITGSLAQENQK
ncbi:MAG: MATE family efflux transporter [Oscillospiraceae bacterium]|nr:MATE family efflux transporter [Oscillospiraceae bacterium]